MAVLLRSYAQVAIAAADDTVQRRNALRIRRHRRPLAVMPLGVSGPNGCGSPIEIGFIGAADSRCRPAISSPPHGDPAEQGAAFGTARQLDDARRATMARWAT